MVVAGRQILGGGGLIPDLFPTPSPRSTRSAGLTHSVNENRTQPTPSASLTDTASILSQPTQIPIEISSASITPSAASSLSTSEVSTTSSVAPPPTVVAPIESTQPPLDSEPATVTAFTTRSPSPSPSIQAAPSNTNNGFLQNKVLSGVVFAIVGVVALVVLLLIATIAIRRSRRRRLVEEAVSFDPTAMGGSELDRASLEKRRFSLLSSDHGHGGSNNSHVTGFGTSSATGTYMPPHVPTQAAYPLHEPYRYPGTTENQYSFSGNPQPWYGGATPNGPYGGYLPQSNLGPARPYPNERDLSQRSGTPTGASSRSRSPEGLPYHHQTGQLKIANT